MQIIGAGFGRAGTMSLKTALEELGFGPCYHMLEVYKHPEHIKTWQAVADGEAVDWQNLLKEYPAGVDYPLSLYYKELMQVFPGAKVILSIRDPQRWYDSTYETIYPLSARPQWFSRFIPVLRDVIKMVDASLWNGLFVGRFEEREFAIQVFNEHIEEVKKYIPANKLLVYSVKEGWEPLCQFLGVPVPDTEFPHVNDRNMIKRALFVLRTLSWLIPVIIVSLAVLLLISLIR